MFYDVILLLALVTSLHMVLLLLSNPSYRKQLALSQECATNVTHIGGDKEAKYVCGKVEEEVGLHENGSDTASLTCQDCCNQY